MKKSTKKRAPEPEPEVLEGEVPTYEEAGLDADFATLVARKVGIAAKIKRLTQDEDDLKAEILAIVAASGHEKIQVDDYRVIYSEGNKNKKIDPKLLMKNGVSAGVIAKSTVIKQGKPFVTVRQAGAEQDEE